MITLSKINWPTVYPRSLRRSGLWHHIVTIGFQNTVNFLAILAICCKKVLFHNNPSLHLGSRYVMTHPCSFSLTDSLSFFWLLLLITKYSVPSGFQRNLETYLRLTLNRPRHLEVFEGKTRLNFAVLHAGAPCCGMNAGESYQMGPFRAHVTWICWS